MTDTPRNSPYCWVTWLAPHLSGDRSCTWAPWYKSHYQYDKRLQDGERAARLASWKAEHADLVTKRWGQLQADGWTVYVEDQNSIKVSGRTITLAGKPDLVAVRGDEARVEDCKTGQRRAADIWQVRTYQTFLPRTHHAIGQRPLFGAVVYRDGVLEIGALSEQERLRVIDLVAQLGGAEPTPVRVPSFSECAFCDVASCPDRVSEEVAVAQTADF